MCFGNVEVHMSKCRPDFPAIKGPPAHALDQVSLWPNAREVLGAFRHALLEIKGAGYRSLEKTFEECIYSRVYKKVETNEKITAYLNRYWFNERSTDVFFPKFQPIAPIFAEGLITTLELSLRGTPNPKPIDMWWLLDYPEVKMINLVSPAQVTLLVATPWPPNVSPREIWGEDAEAYVTGRLGIETRKHENAPTKA
jgi:hypothetical protein